MEENDYIELNLLLAKLRVVCLKTMCELDELSKEPNKNNIKEIRRKKDKTVTLIRNVDNIRKQMPLKIGE